jgi:hypothetical protein
MNQHLTASPSEATDRLAIREFIRPMRIAPDARCRYFVLTVRHS